MSDLTLNDRQKSLICTSSVIKLTTPFHFPVSICIYSSAVELVIFGPGFPPESILWANEYYIVYFRLFTIRYVCVSPLYRGPAELISIHIEDRHDVEAELIKQASHPRVLLV